MTRRYGAAPEAGRDYVRRAGIYAVLPRDGALLVTFQQAPRAEYQLPGGGIDPGESPLQALHREVMEETGWRIAAPRRVGAFRRYTWMPEYGIWAEKLCHIYQARPVLRHGPPTEEGHSAHWLAAPRAVALLGNAGDRAFAQQVARQAVPTGRRQPPDRAPGCDPVS